VLGWLVAGRVLRPLRQMTAATRRISADSLHERLAVTGPGDELKDLADTIDGLLERLEGAFAAQRRFVANASHELRTPLTTMRASVDVAVAKPEPVPAQTIALADRLRAELDRVDGLLDGFLALARAQHGDLPGQTTLSLEYLAAAALAVRADAIAARHLTVHHATGSDGTWVTGSQALLCRMVDNVLDNAIGHNRDGGWISVTTGTDGHLARLVVETGGDVLDAGQVSQLAQPFRRLGADRTGSDHGSGLGLSIVDAIAVAHGGTLGLRARAEGGLAVSIGLPLAAGRLAGAGVPA
jgi:signal transduction histidine kinase